MIRAVVLFGLLAGPLAAQELRIGTESDYAPYVSLQEDGTRTGFDAALMDEVCIRGGWTCSWIETPFSNLFTGLHAGEFDIAIGGIGSTPERDQLVAWTQVYHSIDGGTGAFAGLSEVDLTQARIAVAAGTVHADVAIGLGLNVTGFASYSDAMDALMSGEMDAVFGSSSYFKRLVEAGNDRIINLGELPIPDSGPSIAVGKEDIALLDQLNAILDAMRADGSLATLEAIWFTDGGSDI